MYQRCEQKVLDIAGWVIGWVIGIAVVVVVKVERLRYRRGLRKRYRR